MNLATRILLFAPKPFSVQSLFRFGEQGFLNIPYNPDTLLPRRNLLTYTEQFDNAAWSKSNTTISADQVVAPDGSTTADKVTVTSSASNLVNRSNVTLVPGPGGVVTGSWHWKLGDGALPWLAFIIYSGAESVRAWFNLATGAVGTTQIGGTASGLSASMVAAGGGFYRIVLTGTFASSATVTFEVDQSPTDGAYGGTTGFNYCWGAQLEKGPLSAYQRITDWYTEYLAAAASQISLYQDSAGTTPVTAVGQPVGLRLDMRLGLVRGSELAPATTTTTGWSGSNATVSSVSGRLRVVASTGTIASGYAAIPVVADCWYEVTGSVAFVSGTADSGLQVRDSTSPTTGTLLLNIQPPNGGSATNASGPVRGLFKAAVTGTYYVHCRMGGGVVTVGATNDFTVSVRDVQGNHASQSTSTSRATLSARVNRFLKSGDLSAAVFGIGAGSASTPWEYGAGVNAPVTGVLAPDGTTTGATFNTTSTSHAVRQTVACTAGEQVRFNWYAKSATFAPKYSVYNLTASADIVASTAYPAGIAAANGWTLYSVTVTIPAGCTSASFFPLRDSGATGSIALWGADLRTAADAALAIPAYQRVNTATDYDTAGFPFFLLYDGVDDGMATGNIDFTGTAQMTVFTGVTKNSDAATSVIAELSADGNSNLGTFFIANILGGTMQGQHRGSGSTLTANSSVVAAPASRVIALASNLGASTLTLRLNGVDAASNNNSTGGGNFGNYPLYIGRRGGATLPMNGRDYGLIVLGRAATATEIARTEHWLASRMGVTL